MVDNIVIVSVVGTNLSAGWSHNVVMDGDDDSDDNGMCRALC